MRLSLYPGVEFWYEISVLGIFMVPFFVYQFIYDFTGQKGTFVKNILFVLAVTMVILNLFHVFISHPQVIMVAGEPVFDFKVYWTVVFPIAIATITFIMAGIIAYKSVRYEGMSAKLFTPLIFGVISMFIGTLLELVPAIGSLPTDTFVCFINALCIYYALYKRRIISLTHMTAKSPTYLISAVITTAIIIAFYTPIERFYDERFAEYLSYKTLVFAIAFSVFTMAVYQIIFRLTNNLFVKPKIIQEDELKHFSNAVSQTLDINEIVDIFMDFVTDSIPGSVVHMTSYDKTAQQYHIISSSAGVSAVDLYISPEHPIAVWFANNNDGISFEDFKRTSAYKSMWETEKRQLKDLQVNYFMPIVCDKELKGIVIISTGIKNKPLTFHQISFLQSVAAVLSISIKNSIMYEKMKSEARQDSLTGLYNRRHFIEIAQKDIDSIDGDSYVLALLNLDDFNLYNELYGSTDGDNMLKTFADIVVGVIENKGHIARYGGKEFIISLPHCDIPTANAYVERIRTMLISTLNRAEEKTKKFLTFSAGLCAYPLSANNLTALMTNVGMAVFNAKRNGKNQTVIYKNSNINDDINRFKNSIETLRKKDIGENYAATIYALTAAINAKDQYTCAHSENVSEYASILAMHLGLDDEHVEIIRQAGLLHDIGKIGIPEAILSKKGSLTQDEYGIMQTHVENAINIIRHLPSLDYVIPVAIGHHEHWDGKGYPRGLAGEQIPIGARCLCVVDSFDAMVSRRSYKEPMSVEDALEKIEDSLGTQFDPQIGSLFVRLVREGTITVRGISNCTINV